MAPSRSNVVVDCSLPAEGLREAASEVDRGGRTNRRERIQVSELSCIHSRNLE